MLTNLTAIALFVVAAVLAAGFLYLVESLKSGKIKLNQNDFSMINQGVELIADLGEAIANPVGDQFIEAAKDFVHDAVASAEQVYLGNSDKSTVDRKVVALDLASDMLNVAGYSLGPIEMRVLSGLVEGAVYLLPKTNAEVPPTAPADLFG